MLGFSPTKLLFTAAIIIVVWYGFKWFNRMQENQKKNASSQTPRGPSKAEQAAPKAQEADYEELVACAKCGDYVISDKRSGCGKEGCPYDR
ncbi:hypothetical protein RYZ26_06295 [Terasakiella sp. A23]|uniref:hypothetical protein n=1 Tax=Terasakiella sp. FCG-A23 TaxID=3080561 RepID=UPI0029541A07|nr:hypothetical protein [Terasakiella sp. A23]MDV7339194.1 hypothetical protein [Terasakiella sp. A23]